MLDVENSGLVFRDIQQLWLPFHVIFATRFIDYIIVYPDILAKSFLCEHRKVKIIRDSSQAKGQVRWRRVVAELTKSLIKASVHLPLQD